MPGQAESGQQQRLQPKQKTMASSKSDRSYDRDGGYGEEEMHGSGGEKGEDVEGEKELFSIALDYHHPVVWVLTSLVFVGAHVLFFFGQYVLLWEIRIFAQTSNVSIDCPGIIHYHLNDTAYEKTVQEYVRACVRAW